jgi:hypothetical protein
VKGGAGAGQVAERHRQDLSVADHDMLVSVPIGADTHSVSLRQSGPGRFRLDDMAVRVDDRSGPGRER